MRYLGVILSLLAVSILWGNQTAVRESYLPKLFCNSIDYSLPSGKPLVLEIDTDRFTEEIEQCLKKKLFNEDYTILVHNTAQDYLLLKVNYSETPSLIQKKSFWSRKNTIRKQHKFYFQVIEYPDSKLIYYDSVEFYSEEILRNNEMKWYDPILITAVLGSLAYLIYYGAK